jgi:hypothetical protein
LKSGHRDPALTSGDRSIVWSDDRLLGPADERARVLRSVRAITDALERGTADVDIEHHLTARLFSLDSAPAAWPHVSGTAANGWWCAVPT